MKQLLFIFFVILSHSLFSQTITSVNSHQQGNDIVVSYNVTGANTTQGFDVNLYYSLNNGSYYGRLKSVSGDVGANISGNGAKQITWQVLNEVNSIDGSVQFKVELIPSKVVAKKPKAVNNNMTGTIESCVLSGNTLTVEFLLTSSVWKTYIFKAGKFVVFDNLGNKYYGDVLKWSGSSGDYSKIELLENVPFRISFIINNIGDDKQTIKGMKLESGEYSPLFSLQYRDITPIKQ